jgi:hypothetical protein
MSLTNGLQQFAKAFPVKQRAVFTSTAAQMWSSIKNGSALTGAPAMPKAIPKYPRAGALREGITLTFPDEDTAIIYTTSLYALDVEDNAKGHTFTDGGPNGWKLTEAAFPRIVETTARRIAGASS